MELSWQEVVPVSGTGRTRPVTFPEAPTAPGVYRITMIDPEWWGKRTQYPIDVKASSRVENAHVDPNLWLMPVLLTVGRTTRLSVRLSQHFGANENNNRFLKRLRSLFPTASDADLRRRSIKGLKVEIAECPDWRHRCLAERYGCAIYQPLFDFDAEH
jgi:hypothetical protein